jgi:hypothetical protein
MFFAALLLVCSFPQNGDTQKTVPETPAIVAENGTNDSSLSSSDSLAVKTTLPAVPEAKVKTDMELAAEPVPARPGFQPGTPLRPASTHYSETRTQRKIWYGLVAAGHTAAVFDAWSTRAVLSGNYGTEQNPLLRPFAHSGILYAATQVSPLMMDYLGKHMMTSRSPLLRKMWWLPQSAGAGFSFAAAAHNASIAH